MIRDTEDTVSCWSFPHHLKLGFRVRADGEPVLFILPAPEDIDWPLPSVRPQPDHQPEAHGASDRGSAGAFRSWLRRVWDSAARCLAAARPRMKDRSACERPTSLY